MDRISLNDNWQVAFIHPVSGERYFIEATVPGNIELDLQKANLIDNPIPQTRENAERWIDITDWTYEKEFDYTGLPNGANQAILSFEGIDTAAEIYLNGEKIYECANMFIEHTIDVTNLLKIGKNSLKVIIFAPEIYARRFNNSVFQGSPRQAAAYLRKARHMWGWDNAPHRLSAGIWRNVSIKFLEPIRFKEVYVATQYITENKDKAELTCRYIFDTPDKDLSNYRVRVQFFFEGKCEFEYYGRVLHTVGALTQSRIVIKNPRLWYPAGFGEPNLYDFIITLEKDNQIVAQHTEKIGIRKIKLDRTETTDENGSGEFQIYCNNEKIFIRGTNWKPTSPFHSQVASINEKVLQLAVDCNCNMIRVWGGGIYEGDEFWDFCDKNGIMVWHDFMLACEMPPREDFYLREIEKEATQIVKKYRNRASLAIWCGDNESDNIFYWETLIEANLLPSYNKVTREVFKNVIINNDPTHNFLPSSPYIADELVRQNQKVTPLENYEMLSCVPEQHIYCSNPADFGGFKNHFKLSAAHLSSECGPIFINGMSESEDIVKNELARIIKFWDIDPADTDRENDMVHQCDSYCAAWCKMVKYVLSTMFKKEFSPENYKELIAGVNFFNADFFKFMIESWRVQKFRRTGILWWSLCDMWPMAFNYSVVDSNLKPKLSFDFIRISQQPFALMCDEAKENEVLLHAVNDTGKSVAGSYVVKDDNGKVLAEGEFEVGVNDRQVLTQIELPKGEIAYISWVINGKTYRNFFIRSTEKYDFEKCRKWSEIVRLY
ncbi:MAG: hypothetical protein IJW31_10250 [Lentisphaeria bacterium]|nr:hypothetical protein [Lentisphaeria bacterium]